MPSKPKGKSNLEAEGWEPALKESALSVHRKFPLKESALNVGVPLNRSVSVSLKEANTLSLRASVARQVHNPTTADSGHKAPRSSM